MTSLVLAHPAKLFNVAKILFQTKEFFLYDSERLVFEQRARNLYSMGRGLNYKNEIYIDERVKTCDDGHRQSSLEFIARNYQFFKSEDNPDFDQQKETLWKIWDDYYKKLPPETEQSGYDKQWRLCLARMDTRKMSPTIEEEKSENRFIISFNPELDSELKEYSETSQKTSAESMKYMPLQMWAEARFSREKDTYQKYPQYENNPQLVVSETKEIIEGLQADNKTFSLFNRPTPAYACAVLLRDFFDRLDSEEKEFCRAIIINFASVPTLNEDYYYQGFDGIEPVVSVLSLLIKHFPEDKIQTKLLLFLLLLNPFREISTFATRGILDGLWETNFEDAQSIFLGYLHLKPKYHDLTMEIIDERYAGKVIPFGGVSTEGVISRFCERYEEELEEVVLNKITFESFSDLENIDLEILNTAFEILPPKTTNKIHKDFVTKISSIFAEKIFKDARNEIDYLLKHRFFDKFATFTLNSPPDELETYLRPFVENFGNSRDTAAFFHAFVLAEDILNRYETFWMIWGYFYDKIVEMCRKSRSHHYTSEIVQDYLLVGVKWKEDAKTWRSLKEREKLFFRKISQDIGVFPFVLYSLSQFLNEIGSVFLEEGIVWISDIVARKESIATTELEPGTLYYLEKLVKRYIHMNRQKLKTNLLVKNQIVEILSFMVERGSVPGYFMREDIL